MRAASTEGVPHRNPFNFLNSVKPRSVRTACERRSSTSIWNVKEMDTAGEGAGEPKAPAKGEEKQRPPDSSSAEKDQQIAELTDHLKRLQAEFENHKKRTERAWNERTVLAAQRLVADLLPVLDSFDTALESARESGNKDLQEGLEGLHRQLLQALQREGLKEIKSVDRFDPFLHEALMREERDDVEDGKILEVFLKGYTLGPKVLRPTRVKVAKRKETVKAEKETQVHDQGAGHEEPANIENQNHQR